MKRSSQRPGLSVKSRAKLKRAGVIAMALLAFGLMAYAQVIRPNQLAHAYEYRLSEAALKLESCFTDLTTTTKLQIFSAPDIELRDKRQDLKTIRDNITLCRAELKYFNQESQSLRGLRFSGYTTEYRTANTNQQQALEVVGQSSDVLSQYDQLAAFLDQYFASLEAYVTSTGQLNGAGNTAALASQTHQFAEQGAELHRQAARIRTLNAGAGFETVIQPTAAMLDKAADGFDYLAVGYARGDDYTVTTGFEMIEAADREYNAVVINLPFEKLQASYTVKQVAALPGKLVDLHQAQQHAHSD